MYLIKRILAPTPVFFQHLRNTGLLLTALSGVVLTSPMAIPAGLLTVAGYIALAGGVMGAVSQLVVEDEKQSPEPPIEPVTHEASTGNADPPLPRLRWMRQPEDKGKKYSLRQKLLPEPKKGSLT